MILSLLGKLCDAEALADSDGYVGYCLDLASATHNLPGATPLWITLSTNVAASFGDGNETYKFYIASGTGSDGTDINAGEIVRDETPAIAGDDARLATAGAFIIRRTLDIGYRAIRYLQLKYLHGGTTCVLTVDFSITPWAPRTDYNIQVTDSNVGLP